MQLRPVKEVLKELQLKDFAKELCFIAAIILYLVNVFQGSSTNRKIANKWCLEFGINNGILRQQFAFVGIGVPMPCDAWIRSPEILAAHQLG